MKLEKLLPEWTLAIRPELELRAKGAKPVENRLPDLKGGTSNASKSLRLKEPSPAGRIQPPEGAWLNYLKFAKMNPLGFLFQFGASSSG